MHYFSPILFVKLITIANSFPWQLYILWYFSFFPSISLWNFVWKQC